MINTHNICCIQQGEIQLFTAIDRSSKDQKKAYYDYNRYRSQRRQLACLETTSVLSRQVPKIFTKHETLQHQHHHHVSQVGEQQRQGRRA